MKPVSHNLRMFNTLFAAMGALLLLVAGWIGASVSHLPAIEQKLDDYVSTTDNKLSDHELRLRQIERYQHN